jgi:hypothetical protein
MLVALFFQSSIPYEVECEAGISYLIEVKIPLRALAGEHRAADRPDRNLTNGRAEGVL